MKIGDYATGKVEGLSDKVSPSLEDARKLAEENLSKFHGDQVVVMVVDIVRNSPVWDSATPQQPAPDEHGGRCLCVLESDPAPDAPFRVGDEILAIGMDEDAGNWREGEITTSVPSVKMFTVRFTSGPNTGESVMRMIDNIKYRPVPAPAAALGFGSKVQCGVDINNANWDKKEGTVVSSGEADFLRVIFDIYEKIYTFHKSELTPI